MATQSTVLAWRIPGTGEPGGLPSMGSHRVGHDWSDLAAACTYIPSLLHLLPIPLPCHPSRLSQSTELSPLWYTAAPHQLSISHTAVWLCRCYSVHPRLSFPLCANKSILFVCVFISALQISSSVPFSRFRIYVLIYNICFSFSDLLHSV